MLKNIQGQLKNIFKDGVRYDYGVLCEMQKEKCDHEKPSICKNG